MIKITSFVKFYSLLLLNDGPKHGYSLIKNLSEKMSKKISAGEIYPFLQRLEKIGYVKSASREEKNKKVYELTAAGKEFLFLTLKKFENFISSAASANLTTCVQCGCEIYKGGHIEKIREQHLNFCCKYCANSYKGHAYLI
jgi:DNA-binding PadR family transcriptional regulator